MPFPHPSVDAKVLAFIRLRGGRLLFRTTMQISSNVSKLRRKISLHWKSVNLLSISLRFIGWSTHCAFNFLLKMETFHLYHLAACWGGRSVTSNALSTPLTTGPVNPIISQVAPTHSAHPAPQVSPNSVIWAAAVHMIFASRKSQEFITPKQVDELEKWTGQVWPVSPPCYFSSKSC